jgi:hypothetical protein
MAATLLASGISFAVRRIYPISFPRITVNVDHNCMSREFHGLRSDSKGSARFKVVQSKASQMDRSSYTISVCLTLVTTTLFPDLFKTGNLRTESVSRDYFTLIWQQCKDVTYSTKKLGSFHPHTPLLGNFPLRKKR